jgi:hypothetical protein
MSAATTMIMNITMAVNAAATAAKIITADIDSRNG